MGLAYTAASKSTSCSPVLRTASESRQLLFRRPNAVFRVNSSSSAGASLPSERIALASERDELRPATGIPSIGQDARAWSGPSPDRANGVSTVAAATPIIPTGQPVTDEAAPAPAAASPAKPQAQPIFTPVPEEMIAEFEHKLEADLQTVGVTLTAILGVIIFWRGVWALLDHFFGDSVLGDICCIVVGLTIVLYIRLSGMKIASFWPPS